MALAQLEGGLASGDFVAAVAVDEEDAPEAVLEKVFGETVEEIEIDAGCRGE